MKPEKANWAVVILMALAAGGLVAIGIYKDQIGEILFNATLV